MGAYVSSTGPLSIVVDASKWSTYTGGILETCGTDLDHAVQVVGIDTDEESWKVSRFPIRFQKTASIFLGRGFLFLDEHDQLPLILAG